MVCVCGELWDIHSTLRRPLQNEKRLMEAFVAREAARLADVASRQVRVVLWCGRGVGGL